MKIFFDFGEFVLGGVDDVADVATHDYWLLILQFAISSDNIILIEDEYKEYNKERIKELIVKNSYRGRRIKQGYPARGQRTRTNARTRRGSKKTVAGKKK